MSKETDALGDYMKHFERSAEQRAVKGMPLCARLDGRAFHSFTRGLRRPYDKRLSDIMIATTIELVKETHAIVGYTQSDEISLMWYVDADSASQYLFDGRFQKLSSNLSSIATGTFRELVRSELPEKAGKNPIFDCRIWQVPTKMDAFLMFKWRELDAIKNSISMAAQAKFSHKQLQGVGSEAKKQMLREVDAAWEDEPSFFRRGTYVKRVAVETVLDPEIIAKIPEHRRGSVGETFFRSIVKVVDVPLLTDLEQTGKALALFWERSEPLKADDSFTSGEPHFTGHNMLDR